MRKLNKGLARKRLIIATRRSPHKKSKAATSLINQVFTVGPSVLNAKHGIRVVAVGDAEYGEPSFVTVGRR